MEIKKNLAAALAAAALVVAAPMTGVLPAPLNVAVSAAEYKEGDMFEAVLDTNGDLTGEYSDFNSDDPFLSGKLLSYMCTVKSDNTLRIAFKYNNPNIEEYLPAAYMGKTVTIPSEINGYTVSEIGNCVDLGCTKLVIPDCVTEIADMAFSYNVFLEEVVFGENSQLNRIGQWSFQDCRSLKTINIPANVEIIDFGAFMNGTEEGISGTFIDADLETSEYDFMDTYSLTKVTFAENSKLKVLEEGAFQTQKALVSIELPDSLEKIGYGAFMGCTELPEITIPSNVNEIDIVAFAISPNNEKMKLEKINVADDNKTFMSIDGVLYSKEGKTLVAYPPAKAAGKLEIPAQVSEITSGVFQFTDLTSVTFPEGITVIPGSAFSFCVAMTDVKLPSTLTTIEKWGFEGCGFTSIDIPESVTSIDAQAFESSALTNINGVKGSYAETFAKENSYTFNGESVGESTDKPTPDTGVEDIAPIVGAALIAGAALVVIRKKH